MQVCASHCYYCAGVFALRHWLKSLACVVLFEWRALLILNACLRVFHRSDAESDSEESDDDDDYGSAGNNVTFGRSASNTSAADGSDKSDGLHDGNLHTIVMCCERDDVERALDTTVDLVYLICVCRAHPHVASIRLLRTRVHSDDTHTSPPL